MICPHCKKPISYNISDSQKNKIRGLNKKGYSLRDIQQLTGVSFSTVGRILRTSQS